MDKRNGSKEKSMRDRNSTDKAYRNVAERSRTSSASSFSETPTSSGNGPASMSNGCTAEQIRAVMKIAIALALAEDRENLSKADCFKILGIANNASEDEIKTAYKQLALLIHPDKSKVEGTEDAFKAVNKAYSVLLDRKTKEPDESVNVGRRLDIDDNTMVFLAKAAFSAFVGFGTFKLLNYVIDYFKSKNSVIVRKKE